MDQPKTVLITGANKGIGFEIARALGLKGFNVILSGRDKVRVQDAVNELRALGIAARPLVMDVGKINSIREAFSDLRSNATVVDVLINNAAIVLDEKKSLLDSHPEEVHETFSTNAFGPLFVTQACLPLLPRGGRVINISSGAGSICDGVSGYAPLYSASKTAENALTLHMAEELKGRGISVNLVCPGWVRTDMGGRNAPRSVEKGAETPVWLATEADFTITGKFFRDKKETKL